MIEILIFWFVGFCWAYCLLKKENDKYILDNIKNIGRKWYVDKNTWYYFFLRLVTSLGSFFIVLIFYTSQTKPPKWL